LRRPQLANIKAAVNKNAARRKPLTDSSPKRRLWGDEVFRTPTACLVNGRTPFVNATPVKNTNF
jgi:hypothetical protein